MSNLRLKFLRGEEVKYISHLDLMKVFERALRRSGIPIAYSKGFNPHPEMVFGLPLSVGVTSEAEYADFELEEAIDPVDFISRLNSQLPKGLRVLEAREKFAKGNIMAAIILASYRISVIIDGNIGKNLIEDKIREFIERPSIVVKKETKSKVRDVDIKPMIHQLCVENSDEEDVFRINSLISAGSSANLKPELLYQAFADVSGLEIRLKGIHRTGLFVNKNGAAANPLDEEVLQEKIY